jgi:bifunctional non-homologous end joining protein LigD
MLSEILAGEIHALVPGITTTEVSIQARGKKVYLDPNQNDEADTLASAYSVRPYHLPLVSTPLDWKEVNSRLDPHAFTIDTIRKRLEKKGDLFLGVLDPKNARKNDKAFKNMLGDNE